MWSNKTQDGSIAQDVIRIHAISVERGRTEANERQNDYKVQTVLGALGKLAACNDVVCKQAANAGCIFQCTP